MQTLLQDLRYGLRVLARNPGFTAISHRDAGARDRCSTAIFNVVNAVLLRPLPYPNASRLVWITREVRELKAELAAGADYLDWREQNHSFTDMAAYDEGASFNLTGRGTPERVIAAEVSSSFFTTLGVQPSLGRAMTAEEDRPGGRNVVVITQGFWKRRLGLDAHVLGQTLNLNGESYTVIGVMPGRFRFPGNSETELLVPLALNPQQERLRMQMRIVRIVGLLKPGVTLAQARQDLDLISQRNQPQPAAGGPAPEQAGGAPTGFRPAPQAGQAAALPPPPPAGGPGSLHIAIGAGGPGGPVAMMPHFELKIIPLQQQLVGTMRVALLILLGAVELVLLIACSNVANLMVTRASMRSREVAVRAALGARRSRLARPGWSAETAKVQGNPHRPYIVSIYHVGNHFVKGNPERLGLHL